jgi:hypothetical protein
MIIFNQNFLLKKINKNWFTKNIASQNHRKETERLWQSHSLKPVSLNLSFNNRGQLCCPVNSPNIKTASMSPLSLTGLVIQPHSQLSLTHQKSTINAAPNFLSFLCMFNRGGDVFST